jgi:hypothetical protein
VCGYGRVLVTVRQSPSHNAAATTTSILLAMFPRVGHVVM